MRFVQEAKKRKPSRALGFIGPWVRLQDALFGTYGY
jgi:hypothetical protein